MEIYSSYEFDKINSSRHSKRRLYEIYPGKNTFCCKGSISTGPDIKKLIGALLLYNLPIFIFLGLQIYWIHQKNSQNEKYINWIDSHFNLKASLFFSFLFWFLTNLFLLLTSFVDPGVIQRKPFSNNGKNENENSN
eukprot:Anaeramoba_ignava/a10994_10.p1 GENE.a10994_10~~a10994_10.p1  ORF type:complete len:136 (+),score=27.00 a10994_10:145-552(+)